MSIRRYRRKMWTESFPRAWPKVLVELVREMAAQEFEHLLHGSFFSSSTNPLSNQKERESIVSACVIEPFLFGGEEEEEKEEPWLALGHDDRRVLTFSLFDLRPLHELQLPGRARILQGQSFLVPWRNGNLCVVMGRLVAVFDLVHGKSTHVRRVSETAPAVTALCPLPDGAAYVVAANKLVEVVEFETEQVRCGAVFRGQVSQILGVPGDEDARVGIFTSDGAFIMDTRTGDKLQKLHTGSTVEAWRIVGGGFCWTHQPTSRYAPFLNTNTVLEISNWDAYTNAVREAVDIVCPFHQCFIGQPRDRVCVLHLTDEGIRHTFKDGSFEVRPCPTTFAGPWGAIALRPDQETVFVSLDEGKVFVGDRDLSSSSSSSSPSSPSSPSSHSTLDPKKRFGILGGEEKWQSLHVLRDSSFVSIHGSRVEIFV